MKNFLQIRWDVVSVSVHGVAAFLFIAVWLLVMAAFSLFTAPVMLVMVFCPKHWCLRVKDFVLATIAHAAEVLVFQSPPGSIELQDGRVSINVAGKRWGEP